jgi:hypothetical protein
MLKQVCLLKRRPGMTMDEFKHYYENIHSKLGEKYLPLARRYIRRYVTPEKNPVTGEAEELDFDVVMELWWDSREHFDSSMTKLGDPDIHKEFFEDEERIFNSHHNRVFTVEEHESDMGWDWTKADTLKKK